MCPSEIQRVLSRTSTNQVPDRRSPVLFPRTSSNYPSLTTSFSFGKPAGFGECASNAPQRKRGWKTSNPLIYNDKWYFSNYRFENWMVEKTQRLEWLTPPLYLLCLICASTILLKICFRVRGIGHFAINENDFPTIPIIALPLMVANNLTFY